MTFEARWYQSGAVEATIDYVSEYDGNPCIVLPTGSGKSPTMAMLIRHVQEQWPGTRFIVLAHVKELIEQNADKLRQFWPEADIGIYSAGIGRRDTGNSVIFASIQSVRNKAHVLGNFDFILVDEAHRIPTSGEGAYRTFISAVKKNNRFARVVGFTATPYRLQGGEVCGPNRILTDIAYEVGVGRLIKEGYLCRPIVKDGEAHADLSKLHIRNGDYSAAELDEVMSAEELVNQSMDNFVRLASDRNAWILFGSGEKHIHVMQRALWERHGIEIPIITGKTPKGERGRIIDSYQRREYRGVLNINVLSEGFDAPFIDCVGLFRPTKSPGLYYQQVGRGFRLHPSKDDFLVCDFADNVLEHGPIDKIRPPGSKSGNGTVPARKCPQCSTYCSPSAKECVECGYEFPPPQESELVVKHGVTVSGLQILSGNESEEQWSDVTGWQLVSHRKPGKPPCLRVQYSVGLMSASQWVMFEHGSMRRAEAVQWWRDRGGRMPAPRTVAEAIERQKEIARPAQIYANWGGRYPDVLGVRN